MLQPRRCCRNRWSEIRVCPSPIDLILPPLLRCSSPQCPARYPIDGALLHFRLVYAIEKSAESPPNALGIAYGQLDTLLELDKLLATHSLLRLGVLSGDAFSVNRSLPSIDISEAPNACAGLLTCTEQLANAAGSFDSGLAAGGNIF